MVCPGREPATLNSLWNSRSHGGRGGGAAPPSQPAAAPGAAAAAAAAAGPPPQLSAVPPQKRPVWPAASMGPADGSNAAEVRAEFLAPPPAGGVTVAHGDHPSPSADAPPVALAAQQQQQPAASCWLAPPADLWNLADISGLLGGGQQLVQLPAAAAPGAGSGPGLQPLPAAPGSGLEPLPPPPPPPPPPLQPGPAATGSGQGSKRAPPAAAGGEATPQRRRRSTSRRGLRKVRLVEALSPDNSEEGAIDAGAGVAPSEGPVGVDDNSSLPDAVEAQRVPPLPPLPSPFPPPPQFERDELDDDDGYGDGDVRGGGQPGAGLPGGAVFEADELLDDECEDVACAGGPPEAGSGNPADEEAAGSDGTLWIDGQRTSWGREDDRTILLRALPCGQPVPESVFGEASLSPSSPKPPNPQTPKPHKIRFEMKK